MTPGEGSLNHAGQGGRHDCMTLWANLCHAVLPDPLACMAKTPPGVMQSYSHAWPPWPGHADLPGAF
eukprot:5079602-Amphidinium_carterae.1